MSASGQRSLRSLLFGLGKLVVAGLLLGYLVSSGRLRFDLLATGWQHPGPLLLGALLVLGNLLGTALRFWWLLRACDIPLGCWLALRICFIGNAFNMVLLGGAGGDVVRVVMVGEATGSRLGATAAVFVDRLCGLVGLLLLAALAVLSVPRLAFANEALQALAAVALIASAACAGGFAVGSARQLGGARAGRLALLGSLLLTLLAGLGWGLARSTWLPAGLLLVAVALAGGLAWRLATIEPQTGDGLLRRLAGHLRVYQARPAVLLGAVLLSTLIQLPFVFALPCFAASVGLPDPGLAAQALATPIALLANVAPLPAGGLGGGEAAYALVMEQFPGVGADGAQATAFLMLRLWLLIFGGFGALLLLVGGRPAPEPAGTSAT